MENNVILPNEQFALLQAVEVVKAELLGKDLHTPPITEKTLWKDNGAADLEKHIINLASRFYDFLEGK